MWYIRSSYGVPILTLSLSCDYPPIIFRLWCDSNSEIIAKEKEGINVLKNEHEVHNCDERSARKNASEVHNFMRKEQRNSGRRWLLKYASIASEPRNLILCIALTPQSGDSSGAILEVPFKALLHLPLARNERTLGNTRKRTQKKGLFEFPRKVLLIYGGEEVYTKIATR